MTRKKERKKERRKQGLQCFHVQDRPGFHTTVILLQVLRTLLPFSELDQAENLSTGERAYFVCSDINVHVE